MLIGQVCDRRKLSTDRQQKHHMDCTAITLTHTLQLHHYHMLYTSNKAAHFKWV